MISLKQLAVTADTTNTTIKKKALIDPILPFLNIFSKLISSIILLLIISMPRKVTKNVIFNINDC